MRFVRSTGYAVVAATVMLTAAAALADGPSANRTPTTQSSSAVPGTGRQRTPGVPPGGPDALYAPPPKLAMTTNYDKRFRASYNLVEGSEQYVGGEYAYTGYAYDDHDTTYPSNFDRFGNNCANLIEFRVAPYQGGVLYRFTFNTLLQKDATIATVAFNSDRNAATGSSRLPKDPGLPFPGTDQVLTTWGTGAQWSSWSGSRWMNTDLKVRTDLAANQITIEVPDRIAHPTGDWAATLATGLYDPAAKSWLTLSPSTGAANPSNIVDLGFRFNEDRVVTGNQALVNSNTGNSEFDAPWEHQSAALKAGTPTTFEHVLHFGWLEQHRTWNNIPTHGLFLRMAPSFLAGGTANKGNVPSGISAVDGQGTNGTSVVHVFHTEGKDESAFETEYFSPLQPYLIYVPKHYVPGAPTRLTFWLHPDMGDYWGFGTTYDLPEVLGDDRNSIILDPLSRSRTNFFLDEEEEGLFEAWNDVARHYTLDPQRTIISGGSGGGFGSLNAGSKWPELFAGVVAAVPGGQRGIYVPGVSDGPTVLNNWLPNFRNLPIYVLSDMFSELTFYPGQVQNMLGPQALGNSMEQLKYRYVFRSVAKDHLLIDADRPAIATWMGDREVEDLPFHVTYVRQPSNDDRAAGLVHNKAYWLSDIEIRDNSRPVSKGTIDAVSLAYGLADPDTALKTPTAGVDHVETANAYFQVERTWGDPKPAPRRDEIVITATNIRSVTIDPLQAHLTCRARIVIHSDGPLKVHLVGCP